MCQVDVNLLFCILVQNITKIYKTPIEIAFCCTELFSFTPQQDIIYYVLLSYNKINCSDLVKKTTGYQKFLQHEKKNEKFKSMNFGGWNTSALKISQSILANQSIATDFLATIQKKIQKIKENEMKRREEIFGDLSITFLGIFK